MLKNISLFIVMIIFIGCSIKQPYTTEYKMEIKDFPKNQIIKNCNKKSIKIIQAFSDDTLMSTNMNYILGKYKEYSFTQSQWSIPVNQMVTLHLTNMLNQLNIFKSVQNYKSITTDNYILQSNIIDFKQYFSEDSKSSYVKVIINISLIDYNSNTTIQSKTFSSTIKTDTLDAYGGVKALNKAFSNVLEDIAKWIVISC